MKSKIAEYWKQRKVAQDIVEGFSSLHKKVSPLKKGFLDCYEKNELLAAAKLSSERNCESFISKALWNEYHTRP